MTTDDRYQPVAVVTRDATTIADTLASASLPESAAFATLDDALDATDCDLVVVCTPVELHARDLRTAFAATKHVFVEKCLSNRWGDACELVGEAEAAGVELVVAQNYRYTKATHTLHAAVASGEYGTASIIDIAMHKYRPAPRQQDYPLAMFWDQGCHHADDLQWCFGPIVEVSARTFSVPWSRYRDDAAIQALFTFESGATCSYLLSNVSRASELRFTVHTSRGALTRNGDEWQFAEALAPDDAPFGWNAPPIAVPVPDDVPQSGEHGLLDVLHEAVTQQVDTAVSGRANLETLRVCEMVERATRSGRVVRRDEI